MTKAQATAVGNVLFYFIMFCVIMKIGIVIGFAILGLSLLVKLLTK